jgi:DNA-binding MarR family transcriptional regulator
MNILMILNLGEGKGYKQQELSSLLLVSRANMTKVIDGMEKRGFVTRSASQEDRRAKFIKLTATGKDLANRIIPIQNEKSVQATASLSRNEINILNKLLEKLSKKIIESGKEK